MTDSLFSLGLDYSLVGMTDYCIVPEGASTQAIPLGGPKDVDVEALLRLKPDLVLANQEENSRQVVEALQNAGIPVWLTFPKTVNDAVDILWNLVEIYRCNEPIERLQTLDIALGWERAAGVDRPLKRYFCPIWIETGEQDRNTFMTFNDETYCGDLLHLLGGENVFGGRQRRYPFLANFGEVDAEEPGDRDTRYPWVTAQNICDADPEMLIFPTEPYPFDMETVQSFCQMYPDLQAVRKGKVNLVDGRLVTWYGTRLAQALAELPALFMD